MAAQTFDEWWNTTGCKIGCDTCAAKAAWNAAKLAETVPSASANNRSDEIVANMERAVKYQRGRGYHTVECCDVERWVQQLRAVR